MGSLLIVLLEDLLESSVVELCKFGQVMYIGYDVAQVLLEEHEVLLGWALLTIRYFQSLTLRGAILDGGSIELCHNISDLFFGRLDATNDFATLYPLKSEDLLKLRLELRHETLLVLLGPWLPGRSRIVSCGWGDVVGF